MSEESDGLEKSSGFTFRALLDANVLRSYSNAKRKGTYYVFTLFLWMGFVFAAIVLTGIASDLFELGAYSWLVTVAFVFVANYWLRQRDKKEFVDLAEQQVPYEISVNSLGVARRIGRTETKYEWAEVESINRTSEFLEMKMWDGEAFLIPADCFSDPQEFDLAFDFATEKQKLVVRGNG